MTWIETRSGHRLDYLAPDPSSIEMDDIAFALGNLCRYTGHVWYTVAQHSVMVSRAVPPRHALAGLLHDAAEAYTGDCARPLKHLLTGYREIESAILAVILTKYGLDPKLPREVKIADARMLATEAHQFFGEQRVSRWDLGVSRYEIARIAPLISHGARQLFLDRWFELQGAP